MTVQGSEPWRSIAVGCICALLGAGSEWFFHGRDAATSTDLSTAAGNIQHQLDILTTQNAEDKQEIVALEIQVGQISVKLGLNQGKE